MHLLRRPDHAREYASRCMPGRHHYYNYGWPPLASQGQRIEPPPRSRWPAFHDVGLHQGYPPRRWPVEDHVGNPIPPAPEDLLHTGTIESVTAFLCDYIADNKAQISAVLLRLKGKRVYDTNKFIWEAMQTLDDVIFGGLLYRYGDCSIDCCIQPANFIGCTRDLGQCILTELNLAVIFTKPTSVDEQLAMMLHHMIHAFLMSHTIAEHDAENSEGGASWVHGKAFGAIMYAIKNATALPLSFNHTPMSVALSDQSLMRIARPGSQPRHVWHLKHGRSTNCASNVQEISESDCSKWYTDKCKRLIDDVYVYKFNDKAVLERVQRRALPQSVGGFLEVICNKQNVCVPRSLVEKYASTLGKHFTKNAVLSLPAWAKQDMLTNIYQFLQDQSYSPKLTAAQESHEEDKANAAKFQAPLLLEPKDKSHAYMLTDVNMYKLAKQINFDELAKYALKRLGSIHFTHENPIDVLAEIYCSENDKNTLSAPDDKLRAFVINFLKRYDTVAPGRDDYESSNLYQILERRAYRLGFGQLYGKNISALREDYDKALHELSRLIHVPMSPQPCTTRSMGGYPSFVQFGAVAQPQVAKPSVSNTLATPEHGDAPVLLCLANGTWMQVQVPPHTNLSGGHTEVHCRHGHPERFHGSPAFDLRW